LKRSINILTLLTCIGMFLVLLAGTIVTKMDAGRGCGDDWPLCNGRFIPAYTLESFLEYNHRFISGIVGILVVATFYVVWRHMRDRKEAIFYAAMALAFTVIQAALGAMAVMKPQSDAVLALHFGISLIAFASTLLLVIDVRKKREHAAVPSAYGTGYRWIIWLTIIYCYIVVYTGAYVRHTESYSGCGLDWPLCNGQLIPELTGITEIAFMHRLAALLLFVFIVWLTWLSLRRPQLPSHMRKASVAAFIFIILQILSGALVTFSLSDENIFIFTAILHTMIISALFSVLCYMGIEVWKSRRLKAGHQTAVRTSME